MKLHIKYNLFECSTLVELSKVLKLLFGEV